MFGLFVFIAESERSSNCRQLPDVEAKGITSPMENLHCTSRESLVVTINILMKIVVGRDFS